MSSERWPWSADALEAADRRVAIHPFARVAERSRDGATLMREARGVWLRDVRGREYLDANAGLWCVNAGYGRSEIADAMAEQARRLPFYHSFGPLGSDVGARLAERLVERLGAGARRVFFGLSGSDANETQLKLARLYHRAKGRPGRTRVLVRERGYHGSTLGAGSASRLPGLHEGFGPPLPEFIALRAPRCGGADDAAHSLAFARELEETLEREGPETVAAFLAEPVMGAGGVLVPPEGYFAAIQPILRRHDILFIADEVICAFGRLGHWLGGERFGIEPDLVTLAKGLTSGYAPLSACLVGQRVAEVLEAPGTPSFAHGYTYSGHPVSAAAALANLELLEREGLIERAESLGARLQKGLRERLADRSLVGEVRGVAMIAAVELADPETGEPFDPARGVAARLFHHLLEEGVVCRMMAGDTFGFSPALVASEEEIDEMIVRFASALERLEAER